MKTIASTFAAVLIASAAFASAAQASEGEYYEGTQTQQSQAASTKGASSYGFTGSLAALAGLDRNASNPVVDSGDYYEGANRPS
ncbi:MAG: hypothetical protein KJ947_08110 [Alphaproteobacteria bacterium]|nr:hypothetical protein [Alphaproteobacteria bacterium]MBU1549520.1 hypothetical protein [Alphaproteobacteria bacterium]MBU2334448.1 hypothetical protein [Alphaproteobacteria bacterium]MBU2388891.1 hypothetical protein [Alphaproteobacteria bacterium]